MATRNFYQRNAKRLFVCEQPEEYNEDWFDGKREILHEDACSVAFVPCYNENWCSRIEGKANDLRDYDASTLWCYYEQDFLDKYNNTWRVEVVPLLRAGYYSGACLDYYIKLDAGNWETLDNEDVFNVDTLKSVIADYLAYQRDCRDEDVQGGEGTELLKQIDDMLAAVTEKFYEFAEESGLVEYICRGTFSNGEAVYINKTELEKRALKKG